MHHSVFSRSTVVATVRMPDCMWRGEGDYDAVATKPKVAAVADTDVALVLVAVRSALSRRQHRLLISEPANNPDISSVISSTGDSPDASCAVCMQHTTV
jgi:hypothetical protein